MTQIRSIRLSLTLALAALTLLVAGTATASADPIEGIWTFGGGRVGIQAEPDGTFTGTVVAPTNFAQCTHEAGERMWTHISPQPDGSYWGLHQWFETSTCNRNPVLGPTAWRVLPAEGGRFLRVCFSEPGTAQPTIAPNGAAANATYGCADSARISDLPVVAGEPPARIEAPPANRCKGRGKLRIGIRYPRNEPPAKIDVTLRSGKVRRRAKIVRHGNRALAVLRLAGLARPVFTVEIEIESVLGRKLDRKRRYRLCGRKARRHGHHRRATASASS